VTDLELAMRRSSRSVEHGTYAVRTRPNEEVARGNPAAKDDEGKPCNFTATATG
jgi:hypothetical protein